MIDITNKTKHRLPRQLILKILNHGLRHLKIKRPDLSVVFVAGSLIKKLNSTYRHEHQVTDVLSFSYEFNRSNFTAEIFICYPLLKKNAHQFGHSINQELVKILIHSLLHLVGYTHSQPKDALAMDKLSYKIINSFKF